MTPDQIYAIKRVLMLPPDELCDLRESMRLHDEAVSKIQNALSPGRTSNSGALDAMVKIHEDLQAARN